jgi:hypothetical protein
MSCTAEKKEVTLEGLQRSDDAVFVPVEEGHMLLQFCHIGASTVSKRPRTHLPSLTKHKERKKKGLVT